MLKGKNYLGLNSSMSLNNDAQKGPNLGKLDPNSTDQNWVEKGFLWD